MKVSTSVAALVLAAASSVAVIGHQGLMKPPPLSLEEANEQNAKRDINNVQQARQEHPLRIRGTNNIWSAVEPKPRALAKKNDKSPATGSTGSKIGQTVFEQLLDHENPSLGTFKQSYWYNTEFWTGPGAPVVVFTPGETAAAEYTGYLTNATITGQFAQAIGGAVVMIEHRYWGDSSPFAELTTKNLQYLTLANAIADLTYFARNVKLPFASNSSSSSNAPQAPWVLSGGSYSGALAAWVESVDPGTYWAYHASSAVVEAQGDFWQYFEPIKQGMPQNCSADVQLVIKHIDDVLRKGTDAEVQALKSKFGLGSVVHNDDFAK